MVMVRLHLHLATLLLRRAYAVADVCLLKKSNYTLGLLCFLLQVPDVVVGDMAKVFYLYVISYHGNGIYHNTVIVL